MRPTDEAPHLLSAYRQLQHEGRRRLVTDIMKVAVRRGGADVVRMCERMLEADQFPQELFAHVVLAYAALDPDLEHGRKFVGRKQGAVGRVRAWVRKYMMKYPEATAAEVWEAFKKRPPKGCKVYENVTGKYIETDGVLGETKYRQFANLVSLERPK